MKRQRVVDPYGQGYVNMGLGGLNVGNLPPHMLSQAVQAVAPMGPAPGMGFPTGPLGPQGGFVGAIQEETVGVPFGFFPVVKLRGLPYSCTEDDIQLFLGIDTVDILKVNRGGRFSGEAYVVLGSVVTYEMCLAKNRTYMGKRYVEVFQAKKAGELSP
eukprot:jgi/Botrbrau1/15529/Bobra.0123s0005.1